jgi:hypothetical protein
MLNVAVYWVGVIVLSVVVVLLAYLTLLAAWLHFSTALVFSYIVLKSHYSNPELEVFKKEYTEKTGWQLHWIFTRLTYFKRDLWDGEIRSRGFHYSCKGLVPKGNLIGKFTKG